MTLPAGWHIIGKRADGTVLAEDAEGDLFVGTCRKATYDELTRTVEIISNEEINITFMVGDHLHGKASLNYTAFMADPDVPEVEKAKSPTVEDYVGTYEPTKQYIQAVDPEGNLISIEKTIDVYEWVAL